MSDAPKILLVDDDKAFRKVYGSLLRSEGYDVVEADDRPSAREAFEESGAAVVLLDLMLPPDGSVQAGLEQLGEILSARQDAKVIVISGAGDRRFMVKAVRQGAYDFLTKPVDPDVVLVVVERAMARHRLERQVETLQSTLSAQQPGQSMIGQSSSFQSALSVAERVAPTDLPVLITGENGTGKELMARRVHEASHRHKGAFVPINCGALPEHLLESALFGHVKGAFTGASRDRPGLFREAHEGTLFLDEIGDMPLHLQVKLLRTLETGDILPVGADRSEQVNVRIVSATHQDLQEMQSTGDFREDLYWRIKGAEIHLPPLRERPGDIPLLATHFLNLAATLAPDGHPRELSTEAVEALQSHRWPGNLRELRHEMQRVTVMSRDPVLTPGDFSFASGQALPAEDAPLHEKVESLERREIARALRTHDGNRTHAAEALGLSRQGLLNKMNRYGLAEA